MYRKYSLEPIKNKYGKVVEYKIIEQKRKKKNNVEMIFVRKDGTYVGMDIIKYPFKIVHNEPRKEAIKIFEKRIESDIINKIIKF